MTHRSYSVEYDDWSLSQSTIECHDWEFPSGIFWNGMSGKLFHMHFMENDDWEKVPSAFYEVW